MRNHAQGIQNPSNGIQNPSSADKESGIQGLESESTVWNPKSKTVLDYLAWSDLLYCTYAHLFHKYCKPFNFFFRTHCELFDRLTRSSISLGKFDSALLTFANKRLYNIVFNCAVITVNVMKQNKDAGLRCSKGG